MTELNRIHKTNGRRPTPNAERAGGSKKSRRRGAGYHDQPARRRDLLKVTLYLGVLQPRECGASRREQVIPTQDRNLVPKVQALETGIKPKSREVNWA